jgi:hypothetical protein
MRPKLSTLLVVVAVLAGVLFWPAAAGAGPYRVAICNPDLGSRHPDVIFQRTSDHYLSDAGCGAGQPGLVVRHDGERTGDGRWGAWTLRAPRGTVISHLGVSAAGRGGGGHLPQLLAIPPTGVARVFAAPDPGIERSRFTGLTRALMARLSCRRVSGCSRGRKAHIQIKRLALQLADSARPTISVAGSALKPGSHRGLQFVTAAGTDVGGGIHRFLLQVNGVPVTAQATPCRVRDGVALRLRPCPLSARTAFRMQTTAKPFHQGPNVLRICSADYAVGTAANRACTTRHIRIDNLCPISSTGAGPRLEAHLVHTSGGRDPTSAVRGRLLSASGAPVSGARVCVATRVPIAGALERVVATPTTRPDGSFAAPLPPGPSRQVRVAYWWNGTSVAERYLSLRVHAHPQLLRRPHRPLHNGQHVRFKVELPGPSAGGRWVRLQARSDHRWGEVRNGRTNSHGIYRARYRFHATTGRQRYAFRAVVPTQRGYPYLRGRSRIRHATVMG